MNLQDFKKGMPVVYIPNHLLSVGVINDDQLGIVSSVNDRYVFVVYKGKQGSEATSPTDLFSIENRPDLIERLGLEVKPINRICELWLEEKRLFSEQNSL